MGELLQELKASHGENAGRSDLFEGLDIWKEERYRRLQGTYPVVMVSFASS